MRKQGMASWRVGELASSRRTNSPTHQLAWFPRLRRGGGIALVFLLMFAILTVALTTLAVVASGAASVERDYRSSQALALAEAGLASARAETAAGGSQNSGSRRFDEGTCEWTRAPGHGGWELTARGTVVTPRGITLVRTVRATLRREGSRWTLADWHEEHVR
jgi:hypothetical protein